MLTFNIVNQPPNILQWGMRVGTGSQRSQLSGPVGTPLTFSSGAEVYRIYVIDDVGVTTDTAGVFPYGVILMTVVDGSTYNYDYATGTLTSISGPPAPQGSSSSWLLWLLAIGVGVMLVTKRGKK